MVFVYPGVAEILDFQFLDLLNIAGEDAMLVMLIH
jgi:hypothetical protein